MVLFLWRDHATAQEQCSEHHRQRKDWAQLSHLVGLFTRLMSYTVAGQQ